MSATVVDLSARRAAAHPPPAGPPAAVALGYVAAQLTCGDGQGWTLFPVARLAADGRVEAVRLRAGYVAPWSALLIADAQLPVRAEAFDAGVLEAVCWRAFATLAALNSALRPLMRPLGNPL